MQLIDIKTLSHHTEALTARYMLTMVGNHKLKAWLEASDAHATICNLKNHELCHQLAEKTGTCKKCKINTEGHVITHLNGVALFVRQDMEHRVQEVAEKAKKKSKTDTVLAREQQCVLAAGTQWYLLTPC